jgi:hypothetical protein
MSTEGLELVRHEWEDGDRRLNEARVDPARFRRLLTQVELLVDELRKRVGGTYTLAELAAVYRDADAWARPLVAERAPSPGWPRDLSLVLAAAFHAYQRGASDYAT